MDIEVSANENLSPICPVIMKRIKEIEAIVKSIQYESDNINRD